MLKLQVTGTVVLEIESGYPLQRRDNVLLGRNNILEQSQA